MTLFFQRGPASERSIPPLPRRATSTTEISKRLGSFCAPEPLDTDETLRI